MSSMAGLITKMTAVEMDRCHFRFQLHRGEFDVFVFIDVDPYVLAFGAIGRNFYFEVPVDSRTLTTPGVFQTNTYYTLCEILGLRRSSGDKFTPSAFLTHVNEAMKTARFRAATPKDLAPYRRDVEESEKIWFCGWRDNSTSGQHVTDRNLEKTRQWLGEKAYLRCRERNISSRWTDLQEKAIDFLAA